MAGKKEPLFRLVEVFDEVVGKFGAVRGMLEGMMRSTLVQLDPLIARCYDIRGGVFPSPLHELERKRSEHQDVAGRLQFAWKEHLASRRIDARDGLPVLAWDEFATEVVGGRSAAVLLRKRWPTAVVEASASTAPIGAAVLIHGSPSPSPSA
jgi:hypothetical protein